MNDNKTNQTVALTPSALHDDVKNDENRDERHRDYDGEGGDEDEDDAPRDAICRLVDLAVRVERALHRKRSSSERARERECE